MSGGCGIRHVLDERVNIWEILWNRICSPVKHLKDKAFYEKS